MKRTKVKTILGVTAGTVTLFTLVFWSRISESFGPMEQDELQCLICHRERVEKWVCGSKVRDDIISNQYSEWIDTFIPSTHQHVWVTHTHQNRSHWFGSISIGCGGIPAIPRIFEQREILGESQSQALAAKFHQMVRQDSPQLDIAKLDRFTNAVKENPASLLKPNASD